MLLLNQSLFANRTKKIIRDYPHQGIGLGPLLTNPVFTINFQNKTSTATGVFEFRSTIIEQDKMKVIVIATMPIIISINWGNLEGMVQEQFEIPKLAKDAGQKLLEIIDERKKRTRANGRTRFLDFFDEEYGHLVDLVLTSPS